LRRPTVHEIRAASSGEVDNGGLTPELLREALDLRPGQVKRFLVERRNPEGTDELVILLSKVSSQDIASYPEKLKELDGVREVAIIKKARDQGPNLT
jgi:putative Mg2+ transporter-C (MgtC) family protein